MADDGFDGGPAAEFALDLGRHPSLLAGEEDPELVIGRCIVAAISLVGEDARDAAADQRLHVRDHGFQGVAIIWIAGQRLDVGDELAALAVLEGGGNADLDAELVRPMGLPLADAFDFRRMQGIDHRAALTLLLLAYACGADASARWHFNVARISALLTAAYCGARVRGERPTTSIIAHRSEPARDRHA